MTMYRQVCLKVNVLSFTLHYIMVSFPSMCRYPSVRVRSYRAMYRAMYRDHARFL